MSKVSIDGKDSTNLVINSKKVIKVQIDDKVLNFNRKVHYDAVDIENKDVQWWSVITSNQDDRGGPTKTLHGWYIRMMGMEGSSGEVWKHGPAFIYIHEVNKIKNFTLNFTVYARHNGSNHRDTAETCYKDWEDMRDQGHYWSSSNSRSSRNGDNDVRREYFTIKWDSSSANHLDVRTRSGFHTTSAMGSWNQFYVSWGDQQQFFLRYAKVGNDIRIYLSPYYWNEGGEQGVTAAVQEFSIDIEKEY